MLASASTGASNRAPVDVAMLVENGGWVLDTKLDGIRAWWRNNRLTNRVGIDITTRFPEVTKLLNKVAKDQWFDGEIVALDGKFETVAQRDKLEQPARRKAGAAANPCTFIAFDAPGIREDWSKRRQFIEAIHGLTGLMVTPISYETEFIEQVQGLGLEGVIAKRVTSRYQFGKRSPDWIKHKFTQRISCLIQGYEAGSQPLGAIKLALFDHKASEVVEVGRCGSGFTEKQRRDLKVRLDAGEILVAEIETLNLTSHGTLRFPVFRGLRSDIAPLACTVDQLDSLPRSGKSI